MRSRTMRRGETPTASAARVRFAGRQESTSGRVGRAHAHRVRTAASTSVASTPTPRPATMRDVVAPEHRTAAVAILLTVALASFEGLAVTAALPQVAADLGSVALLPWVMSAFGLTSGVATVATGALIDGIGVSRVFRVAVAVFAIGGVAAGLSGSMPMMIVARMVQGAGAGATIAVSFAAVGLVFPPRLVGRAFALTSTVWAVMGVAAPAVTAAMLTAGSWRWIFLVNLPLGGLALLAGWQTMPDRGRGQRTPADVVGLALVAVFSAAILLGVDAIGTRSLAGAGIAVLVGWLYLRIADRREFPVLRPRHVVRMPFGALAWAVSLLLAGVVAVEAFVPLYVQGGRGAGTATAAWSVLFLTVGWTAGAHAASSLADRVADSTVMLAGFAICAPASVLVAGLAAIDAPLWAIFVALCLEGTGVGAATNAALTLLRAVAGDDEMGRATAAHQFLRTQGVTVGAALGGATLLLVVTERIGDAERVRDLLAGGSDVTTAVVADAIAAGFTTAAVVGAVLIAAGIMPVLALRRHLRGEHAPQRSTSLAERASSSR